MQRIALVLLFAATFTQASISKNEIHNLIESGAKGAIACNKTFDEIRALDKKFDDGRTFPNKKTSLLVVQKLAKFPGTPSATKELMDRLVTTKIKNLDTLWLSKEMDRAIVCDPMALNLTLTKLVRSSRQFGFSKQEKKQMSNVIVDQLRKEAEFPTHLGLLAPYVLILDALVEQQSLKLSTEASIKRQELRQVLDQGLAKLKDREELLKENINNKEFQTKNFIAEVRENEAFRVKFLEFIDTL